jgi:hypothetical protein
MAATVIAPNGLEGEEEGKELREKSVSIARGRRPCRGEQEGRGWRRGEEGRKRTG